MLYESHGSSDSAQPFPHDDDAIMGQEGESYSAQPLPHDDEATREQEGEFYSAQPARPSQQQIVLKLSGLVKLPGSF